MSGASELVERLEIALGEVTPSPWRCKAVCDDGSLVMTDADDEWLTSGGFKRDADADYMFTCEPANIAELLAELSRLSSAHSEAVEDARKHLAELSASRAEAGRLREALKEARRAIGDHHAPSDCYATGPLTGDPFRDLVQCPACSFIAMYDAALAGEKPVGAGVETLATDYLRGKIGEIIALQLDIEGGRAVEQAVEQILAVAALSKSGEKP